jgi:Transposase DDE domain
MTGPSHIAQLVLWSQTDWPPKKPAKRPSLHTFWRERSALPGFVRDCPVAMRSLDLLGPLDWDAVPERDLTRDWGQTIIPQTALLAAWLVGLNDGRGSASALHTYLIEHPALIWLLGFPLQPAPNTPLGFNAQASLTTPQHWTKLLRWLPNTAFHFLLADSVGVILDELRGLGAPSPECVSLDTKHILAWVKENNPKTYVADRFNKARQPAGDPDCRLGCKRRTNQGARPTPTHNPVAPQTFKRGEYYWGYGSGLVVTKVPDWGEFVLAELTQPFDQGDVTYFFPLMQQTEDRLGYRPRIGTLDAAFDAWYIYAYFHRENDPTGGFAAVPFSEKGGYKAGGRQFSPEGLPLCAAGLAMPLAFTYTDRTTCLVEHERGKYVCPLPRGRGGRVACPIRHANAKRGGCTAMMPTSIGARLRYTLDRQSEEYKAAYNQRTAVERINSQALGLGIERPHLRNQQAITNRNTLIYVLINLRFLQRLRQRHPTHD